MSPSKLEEMTADELEAEIQRFQADRAAIDEKQDAVRVVLDRKLTADRAEATLATMSDQQINALVVAADARATGGGNG